MSKSKRERENAEFRELIAKLDSDTTRSLLLFAKALESIDDLADCDSAWLSQLAVDMPWMLDASAQSIASRGAS